MRNLLAAVAVLCAGASASLADPVHGTWKTQPDDGAYAHVKIAPCGSKICGTITRTFNSSGEFASDTVGKQLILGMVPAGGRLYKGRVWRPSNDKIYRGKLQLNGNSLQMSGCVAGGLICAKQKWSRLK